MKDRVFENLANDFYSELLEIKKKEVLEFVSLAESAIKLRSQTFEVANNIFLKDNAMLKELLAISCRGGINNFEKVEKELTVFNDDLNIYIPSFPKDSPGMLALINKDLTYLEKMYKTNIVDVFNNLVKQLLIDHDAHFNKFQPLTLENVDEWREKTYQLYTDVNNKVDKLQNTAIEYFAKLNKILDIVNGAKNKEYKSTANNEQTTGATLGTSPFGKFATNKEPQTGVQEIKEDKPSLSKK